jgi:hypothetical protein
MTFEIVTTITYCSMCPYFRQVRDVIHLDRHCSETGLSFEEETKWYFEIDPKCPYDEREV